MTFNAIGMENGWRTLNFYRKIQNEFPFHAELGILIWLDVMTLVWKLKTSAFVWFAIGFCCTTTSSKLLHFHFFLQTLEFFAVLLVKENVDHSLFSLIFSFDLKIRGFLEFRPTRKMSGKFLIGCRTRPKVLREIRSEFMVCHWSKIFQENENSLCYQLTSSCLEFDHFR